MQPTCRRSAHTGAGHGSPAPARRASSSEFETSRRSACTLPSTVQASSVRCPPGVEAVARLAVGGGRDREQPAAAAGARPQNATSSSAEASITESFAVDLRAFDRDDRPDDAVVERHRRERVQDDQARAADRVRRAVGVARDARARACSGAGRACAAPRRRTPRSRAARRRARARSGRPSCRDPSRAGAGRRARAAGARGSPTRSTTVAVGRVRRGRRRRDRRRRGVAAAVEDLHCAAAGDRRERRRRAGRRRRRARSCSACSSDFARS